MRYTRWLLVLFVSFSCKNKTAEKNDQQAAAGWALLPFQKQNEVNPIMVPDSTAQFFCPVRKRIVRWEEKDVFNPAAVVRQDTVFLLYRAEDKIGKFAGTSRIGLAWSRDGFHFSKLPSPVLNPDNDPEKKYEWEGGCEDPRIVEDDRGQYYLTYTGYDGDKARLMIASSSDLRHWTKHGLAFAGAEKGKYIDLWSKSGSIVSSYKNSRAVAVKINGRYWMYWGDTNIFLASSEDLIHWAPVEDGKGNLLIVFGPRRKKFDSDIVESGPPAMLTDSGIVLIYNSRNVQAKGDSNLAEGTYAASQVLLDKDDPSKLVQRMENYFIRPDHPYEISGQVNQVCFLEGLVNYKGKWLLYYGTADSRIAVAVKMAP